MNLKRYPDFIWIGRQAFVNDNETKNQVENCDAEERKDGGEKTFVFRIGVEVKKVGNEE